MDTNMAYFLRSDRYQYMMDAKWDGYYQIINIAIIPQK